MKSTITLQDVADKDSRTEVNYLINPCGIEIGFKGFGECCMQNGYGHPVFIEIRNGIPFVLIWGNINDENPTQTISLVGAMENKRRHK